MWYNMRYKGYKGSFRAYPDQPIYYGKMEGIPDLVDFEGSTIEEVEKAFKEAVDSFLVETKHGH